MRTVIKPILKELGLCEVDEPQADHLEQAQMNWEVRHWPRGVQPARRAARPPTADTARAALRVTGAVGEAEEGTPLSLTARQPPPCI